MDLAFSTLTSFLPYFVDHDENRMKNIPKSWVLRDQNWVLYLTPRSNVVVNRTSIIDYLSALENCHVLFIYLQYTFILLVINNLFLYDL